MTTQNLRFYDAAYPPALPPTGFDGVAFYIGGDTPHVWTMAEITAQMVRFRLPIYTRSDPVAANAKADAEAAIAQLGVIGAPKGTLVALDSETSADPNYVAEFYYALRTAGYVLIDYGSVSTLFGNHIPDGYYWGGDWTTVQHLVPGTQMTQWQALDAYDVSTALPTLPFWDTRPPGSSTPPPDQDLTETEHIMTSLPSVSSGDQGPEVSRVQALLVASGYEMGLTGPRRDGIDGVFGPVTESAVRDFQEARKLTVDGIVGTGQTWPALLGV